MDKKVSSEIKVKGVHGVFSVRMEEATLQVSIEWVNNFLGLKQHGRRDTGPRMKSMEFEKVGEERGVSVVSGFQEAGKGNESFVEDTLECNRGIFSQGKEKEQGIKLCIDLRDQDSGGNMVGFSNVLENSEFVTSRRKVGWVERCRKGKGLDSVIKSHPMKTRRAKLPQNETSSRQKRLKKVNWNLEEEINKVVKRGTELGVDFKSRFACNRIEDGSYWDLEEEVTKVIETGAALGIDFNGREVEIREIVSSKESEEATKYNA
ncbi:hypothetical protein LWI28_011788 [Acer negundo]|uniref:Uncharacterized protein n=1 Tax=Acer negundo TaxID=4023 RepID=A0AAD5NUT6_ACENE|nr:hypothetical protein LWI28_011788 [Acer negundo]